MNKVVLCGRLTRDPEIRYSQGEKSIAIARYTLAVGRKQKKQGSDNTDFISCVAFGKNGEFAEKYLRQGIKIIICGHIQTGSYTNRDGQRVYTCDVVVDEQEFAESKSTSQNTSVNTHSSTESTPTENSWTNIPDGLDESLPFN